jgi:hypothetical protein
MTNMGTLKKTILLLLMGFISIHGFSQHITGNFKIYEDENGKDVIYFKTTNLTGYQLSNMSLILENEKKNQSIQLFHNGLWFSNGYNADYSLMVGPNYGWTWEKGEQVRMYINGQYHGSWVCDIAIPSLLDKIIENKPKARLPKGWMKGVVKVLKKVR